MNSENPGIEPDGENPQMDPAVTLDLFLKWRTPRFGRSNPERMNNPVWEWLIRSRLDAYSATQKLGGPSACDAGPGWCFDRFGQSSTELPDGRKVLIAGEHEDYYDPDFHIYNDVVVLHPDGHMDILGYPAEVFPPTDFHTATGVVERIIIIGSLGYPEQRKPGTTPVMVLDLTDFSVSSVKTTGLPPGWIHRHEAVLEEGETSILIRRGMLDRGDEDASLVENIDDWRLHLADWRWERITERHWPRWEILRKDRRPNHLWEIQQALWYRRVRWNNDLDAQMEKLTQELGAQPDLDLAGTLFCPPVPHEKIPENEEEYNVTRIKVNGILVRYVADTSSIVMTAEGDLDPTIAKTLVTDLAEKLTKLENTPIDLKQIG